DLTIYPTLHSAGRVLALGGEIDMPTEHNFQEAVTEALVPQPHGRVVLHRTDLRFIDSSGLRARIPAPTTAKEPQVLRASAAPAHRVLQTLRVTSFDTRIPIFDTVSEALTASFGDG